MTLLLGAVGAQASNCPGYTYILTNGQTADASQVMANFNTVRNCANTLVAPAALANYAPLISPQFTGVPTAPTQAAGDNTTAIATDAFVQSAANSKGLQSAGQVTVSSSLTLGASQAGRNLLVSGSSTTLTFPASVATYWLNNEGSSDVPLVFPVGTDFRTVLHPGEQVGLAGDGGGFWRTVAAGVPLYGVTASAGDNSTQVATTAFVTATVATAVANIRPPVFAEYSCVPSACTYNAGSGVASVTYNSVGNYSVTFTAPFISANYVVSISGNQPQVWVSSQLAGSIQVMTANSVGTMTDSKFYLIIYGI